MGSDALSLEDKIISQGKHALMLWPLNGPRLFHLPKNSKMHPHGTRFKLEAWRIVRILISKNPRLRKNGATFSMVLEVSTCKNLEEDANLS